MTLLNLISIVLFMIIMAALIIKYNNLRHRVEEAEGFMGVRDAAQVPDGVDGASRNSVDVVAALGDSSTQDLRA